jgi:hypothetical protein
MERIRRYAPLERSTKKPICGLFKVNAMLLPMSFNVHERYVVAGWVSERKAKESGAGLLFTPHTNITAKQQTACYFFL